MLRHARRLAAEGHAVYVIAADNMQREHLRLVLEDAPGVKVETPSSLGLDWRTLRAHGMHQNCVVLVDHYAIERQFGPMLEMLHAYDEDA